MRKIFYLLAIIIISLPSCKKENKDDDSAPNNTQPTITYSRNMSGTYIEKSLQYSNPTPPYNVLTNTVSSFTITANPHLNFSVDQFNSWIHASIFAFVTDTNAVMNSAVVNTEIEFSGGTIRYNPSDSTLHMTYSFKHYDLVGTLIDNPTYSYIYQKTTPAPPVPDFTFNGANAPAPDTVTFVNMTLYATSYLWDFGDGSTSTDENPTHIYLSNSLYTATLTATGPGGTASVSHPINVSLFQTTYTLKSKDVLGVSGTITFTETNATQTTIKILLTGAPMGNHPAYIHNNSAVEGGSISLALNDVDATGISTTLVMQSYTQLIAYDGYADVRLDATSIGTIIAVGDIGGNALTGTSKNYVMMGDSSSGVTGNAKFEERINGNTLITVDLLSGISLPAGQYPADICLGSIATIGPPVITKTLNTVDGNTRKCFTNVRTLNNGTPITYTNWMFYDGHLIIRDAVDTTNIISKGNIGAN